MPNLSLKQKIMIIIAILGAILIFIFQRGLYGSPQASSEKVIPQTKQEFKVEVNKEPEVVSTNPNPLEETIILPSQKVEITFNLPLENADQFKNKLEPKIDYKIILSSDRKTAEVSPIPSFKLGSSYTLFIMPDTKFDGGKKLNREIIYHFKTISYQGV
ncbi:MAG: Ig-like domain-containing protein [Candidatus Daviesbacteria bacterium]